MPIVTYVDADGTERRIDVPVGWTLMEGAVKNGVEGIVAECGGSLACATCHVYVDPAWQDRLEPASDMEREMLACTAEPEQPNSRLSCQIKMDAALDGIVLRLPDRQL